MDNKVKYIGTVVILFSLLVTPLVVASLFGGDTIIITMPVSLNISDVAYRSANNVFSGNNNHTGTEFFMGDVIINNVNETVLNLNVTGVTRFYNSTYNNSVDTVKDGWGIIPIGTWLYFEDSGKNLRRMIGVTTQGVIEIGNTPTVVITGIKMMAGTNGNVTIFNSTGEIFKVTSNGNVTINGTLEIYKNVIRVWNGATSIQLTGNGLSWSSGDSVGSNLWSSTTASSIRNYDGTQYKTSIAFNNSRNANQPSVTVFSKNYTDRTKPIVVFWNDLRTELAGNLTVNGSASIGTSTPLSGYALDVNGYIHGTSLMLNSSNARLRLQREDASNYIDFNNAQTLTIRAISPTDTNTTNMIIINPVTNSTLIIGNLTLTTGNITIPKGSILINTTKYGTCAIANEGEIVYNSTDKKHYGCNSTTWNALY